MHCHRYKCPQCPKTLVDKKGLDEHVKNIHETVYKCYSCESCFNMEKKLVNYFEKEHDAAKPCPLCHKVSKNIRALRKHMKKFCKGRKVNVTTQGAIPVVTSKEYSVVDC